ncbi:hypothetical protein J2W23_002277 [Variovorax boronicumulans]|uniref:hypothetical protein n=1 Tax=Variovorax boronicumulans TaxID=436515 RepID=UPI002782D2AE|nr:hypothetical protein [Variovorax boronicumulans]MDQ0013895.1 hypothetical protein [Variovorax boronicumulans]
MFNCTEAFRIKHIRLLGPGGTDDSRAAVLHQAGVTWAARTMVLSHGAANTVMFLSPAHMNPLQIAIGALGPNQANANVMVRIPWAVTWVNAMQDEIIKDAAGFVCSTDAQGECCHFGGILKDGLSQSHTHWRN